MELVRKRVVELIEKAFQKRRIVYIIAPIGYGKTIAARQFLTENKINFFDNTFYKNIVNKEDYDEYIDKVRHTLGLGHLNWTGDTKRIGDMLKDRYQYSLHDNVERMKYVRLVEERSNIYLQGANNVKSLVLTRGKTYFKIDEMLAKNVATVITAADLAFTKDEIEDYARLNDIAYTDGDIRYCLGELGCVPLYVTQYFNGGGTRCSKPYLPLQKSTFYDAYDQDTRRLLQVFALFKTFTDRQIKAIYPNHDLVDKVIELGHKYEGFLIYNQESNTYTCDRFLQEALMNCIGNTVVQSYSGDIIRHKLDIGESVQALSITMKCRDRRAAIALFNTDAFTLEHPTLFDDFNSYIVKFSADEQKNYPYAYLKFAYAELFNCGDDQVRRDFMAYYNALLTDENHTPDRDKLLANCRLIRLLCGLIDFASYNIEATSSGGYTADDIKIVDIGRVFRHNYILMSMRTYAPQLGLKEFYCQDIARFQYLGGVPMDIYNDLYLAEYDVITGNWKKAKDDLELIMAKADMNQDYELMIRSRLLLARTCYYCRSTENVKDYLHTMEQIKEKATFARVLTYAATKYIKQYLGRHGGFRIDIENVFHRRMLNNYGSYYLKQYIMKCFVIEKRYDELKIYLSLCFEKLAKSIVHADEPLILLYRAVLSQKLGDTDAAIQDLVRCINIASMDGIFDFYLDEAKNLIPILAAVERNAKGQLRDHEYFERVFIKCQEFATWQAAQEEKLLNDRECEVLRHMSNNMRRKEIAALMYLSPETVKKYMQSLYKKLGASDYVEALSKAKKLNLI